MSSQQGWIALNRKIVENPMWLSEPFSRSHAWIDLILLANHKPNFFFIRDIKFLKIVRKGTTDNFKKIQGYQ